MYILCIIYSIHIMKTWKHVADLLKEPNNSVWPSTCDIDNSSLTVMMIVKPEDQTPQKRAAHPGHTP